MEYNIRKKRQRDEIFIAEQEEKSKIAATAAAANVNVHKERERCDFDSHINYGSSARKRGGENIYAHGAPVSTVRILTLNGYAEAFDLMALL